MSQHAVSLGRSVYTLWAQDPTVSWADIAQQTGAMDGVAAQSAGRVYARRHHLPWSLQRRAQIHACEACGKQFKRRGRRVRRFCSRPCYWEMAKGQTEEASSKRPSYRIYGGYRWIPITDPRVSPDLIERRKLLAGMYVQEHVVVAESMLGRALLPEEVVHHVNLERLDNREDNLIVFASQAVHRHAHHLMMVAFRDQCLQVDNPKSALLQHIPDIAPLVQK